VRDIVRKLKRKLLHTDTRERCGLVLSDGMVFQLDNIHPDPERGFMISGVELFKYQTMLAGTWHTHPGQSSVFSQEDHDGFMQWPDLTHFIVGNDGVRAYRVEDGIIREVDLAAD
jgi:proteasome lid subunit RPN8/RPN11